ncbi:MAG: glycosyltransferase family 4 protein [Candidatus Thorarchaeota archaeon]
MDILHITDSLNPAGLGGYEAYLHYLSAELKQGGHRSLVATQAQKRDSPESISFPNYEVIFLQGNLLEARKWELFSLPESERESVVEKLFHPDDLEENVKQLVEQLRRLIQDVKPDIIHAHSTYVVFNKVLEILKNGPLLDEIPILVTIHGVPKPLILPSGEKTTDYAELISSCPFDRILGVSDFVCEELKKNLPEEKGNLVERLYLGINLDVFRPDPEIVKEWDVIFMGRLEPMKSVDLFPEMVSILSKKFPDLRVAMTGEGSLKKQLLDEFEEKNVEEFVEYLGVVETSKVPELINKSRVFIYPSRREPFGLSIVEAMACGVPIVTTNVYGPKEIVTHNHDGMAISPDDVLELVEAIKILLLDERLRERLARNARIMVEDRFDIKKHALSLVAMYEDSKRASKRKVGGV